MRGGPPAPSFGTDVYSTSIDRSTLVSLPNAWEDGTSNVLRLVTTPTLVAKYDGSINPTASTYFGNNTFPASPVLYSTPADVRTGATPAWSGSAWVAGSLQDGRSASALLSASGTVTPGASDTQVWLVETDSSGVVYGFVQVLVAPYNSASYAAVTDPVLALAAQGNASNAAAITLYLSATSANAIIGATASGLAFEYAAMSADDVATYFLPPTVQVGFNGAFTASGQTEAQYGVWYFAKGAPAWIRSGNLMVSQAFTATTAGVSQGQDPGTYVSQQATQPMAIAVGAGVVMANGMPTLPITDPQDYEYFFAAGAFTIDLTSGQLTVYSSDISMTQATQPATADLVGSYAGAKASATGVQWLNTVAAAYDQESISCALHPGAALSLAATYTSSTVFGSLGRAGVTAAYGGQQIRVTASPAFTSRMAAAAPSRGASGSVVAGSVLSLAAAYRQAAISVGSQRGHAATVAAVAPGRRIRVVSQQASSFSMRSMWNGPSAEVEVYRLPSMAVRARYDGFQYGGLAVQHGESMCYVMCASTKSVAEQASSPYREVVQCGDRTFAITAAGLVEVGADTDAGVPVTATLETFHWASAAGMQVQLSGLYINGSVNSGSVVVNAEVNKQAVQYQYSVEQARPGLWKQRVLVGRGLRADRVAFKMALTGPVSVTGIELLATPSSRRI